MAAWTNELYEKNFHRIWIQFTDWYCLTNDYERLPTVLFPDAHALMMNQWQTYFLGQRAALTSYQ